MNGSGEAMSVSNWLPESESSGSTLYGTLCNVLSSPAQFLHAKWRIQITNKQPGHFSKFITWFTLLLMCFVHMHLNLAHLLLS